MNNIHRFFGWNSKVWCAPFLSAVKDFSIQDSLEILEIGAGSHSAISLSFLDTANNIDVTCYPEAQLPGLIKFVEGYSQGVAKKPSVYSMSAKDVVGKYDLIIMKSVLGGIFRENSIGDDWNDLLQKIYENNLKNGGVLITLDNGATILEPALSNFGARANGWKFFVPSDFKNFTKQYFFGFFSSFSFSTRLGKAGVFIENLFYEIDSIVFKFFKIKRPSVIVTVYKR